MTLTAPFPYYGGKSRIAGEVWRRFGHADVYSEPFAGSLAVLLGNPHPSPRREVVCDTDGHICNVWRAITHAPDEVAHHATHPTFQQCLTARHAWLIQWGRDNAHRLSEDMDYYDPKAAGIWIWGKSIWIGGGWGEKHSDKLPYRRTNVGGNGVNRERVAYPFERPGDDNRLLGWMGALADRLSKVTVLNADWVYAVNTSSMSCRFPRNGEIRCVFLDPPYRTSLRTTGLYRSDADADATDDVAVASYEWAVEHGDRYRIAYCCHDTDFSVPDGWDAVNQKFSAYTKAAKKTKDLIMFSPACDTPGLLK